ncbi:unnamed protein product [Meganyctiphanes norvegica]|uniref:RING-type domain-containing protein n=1 Tax=Meganyctiphanes norvegica TaxID=48144 RepID=A0AAV2PL79_MEGNR
MSNQPECEVCLEEFDEDKHSPRSLTCGHSMCTTCITSTLASNKGTLLCPFCRIASTSSLTSKSAKDFPINYSLLKLLQPASPKSPGSSHESSSTKEDEEALQRIKQMELDSASAQLLTCDDHLNQLLQQKVLLNAQQKLLDTHKRKFEDIVSRHQKLLALTEKQVIDAVQSVEDLLSKGRLIQTAIKDNIDKLDESFKGSGNHTVVNDLQNHNDSLFEWTKETIPRQDSKPLISTIELITSATSKVVLSLNGLATSIISKRDDTSTSKRDSNSSASQGIVISNSSQNTTRYSNTLKQHSEDNISTHDDQIQTIAKFLQSSTTSAEICNQIGPSQSPLGASSLSTSPQITAQELVTILEDAEIRGQNLYAILDKKLLTDLKLSKSGVSRRAAQIKVVDGLTLLYCLQPDVNLENSQKVSYDSIRHLIPNSGAQTFLEVCWTNKLRGRIIIKMYRDTNRGKQFNLMCSGELGPSYVGTKLDQIRAVYGSYVHGGNYDGKSGKALIADLENGGNCSHDMKDGIVVGSNKSTLFTIHHKSASYQNTMAFGEVEKGMDTVRFIPKVSDARISNCGLILEL